LGEVCDIKGGKRLPKDESLISKKTDHYYIRITDLENNSIQKNKLLFITEKTFSKISRYIVNYGDIIISIV
jgi:type I restriction enzyme, S subunit